MRALVLDFDGVISDSVRESFTVASESFLRMRPGSPLRDGDPAELYRRFVELMPLGNRAEDFGTALLAIEEGAALPDQDAYDRFRSRQDESWLARYHVLFYRVRREMAATDPDAWYALMQPYPGIRELLRRRAGSAEYAIATSKDGRSVRQLLAHYGLGDLFPAGRVLDKELGENKAVHLEEIRRRTGLEPAAIAFIDDKVNHLDRVAPLGVRCALAGWGYNGERERQLALERGYIVLTLEDAEERLFAG